jgi:hypothetical protein
MYPSFYAKLPQLLARQNANEASQINYRMRATLADGRQMTGQLLAFDKVC